MCVSYLLKKKSGGRGGVINFRDRERTCTKSFAQDKSTHTQYSRLMTHVSRLMPCNIVDWIAIESSGSQLVDWIAIESSGSQLVNLYLLLVN